MALTVNDVFFFLTLLSSALPYILHRSIQQHNMVRHVERKQTYI